MQRASREKPKVAVETIDVSGDNMDVGGLREEASGQERGMGEDEYDGDGRATDDDGEDAVDEEGYDEEDEVDEDAVEVEGMLQYR